MEKIGSPFKIIRTPIAELAALAQHHPAARTTGFVLQVIDVEAPESSRN